MNFSKNGIFYKLISYIISKPSFQIIGQTPRSGSQGKKCWYPQKSVVTRNNRVKYQYSSIRCSKVLSKDRINLWQKDKSYMPQIFDLGGIKICLHLLIHQKILIVIFLTHKHVKYVSSGSPGFLEQYQHHTNFSKIRDRSFFYSYSLCGIEKSIDIILFRTPKTF